MSNDYDDTLAALPGEVAALAPSQAYLVVVRGTNVGETFPVVGPAMVIGRGAGADVRLNDESISRFHCKILQDQGGFLLADLGSRNGTFCNGEPVIPAMRTLHEGDRLQIGTTFVLRFTYVENSSRASSTSLSQNTVRDPLTGVFSKHFFMDQLE
jgi:two-component system cell cycle response regulator